MAKIGNEARLILKLAAERAEAEATSILSRLGDDDVSSHYRQGKASGLRDCVRIYQAVCTELERG